MSHHRILFGDVRKGVHEQPVECQLVRRSRSAHASAAIATADITQYETTQEPIQQALALNSCHLPMRASAEVENSKFNMRV